MKKMNDKIKSFASTLSSKLNCVMHKKQVTCLIPKNMYEDYESFVAVGFQFEEDSQHEHLYKSTLPMGWTVKPGTNGNFYLHDAQNRLRANVIMKDTYMGIGLERRYNVFEFYNQNTHSYAISVVDWDKTILFTTTGHCTSHLTKSRTGYVRTSEYNAILAECDAYLENNFPEWQDPTKYWD